MAVATTTVLAIASLVVAAGTAVAANQNAQEARSDQKKANDVAAAQRNQQQQAAIREQVRQDRIRRASILNMSADTGTTASSGSLGAIGSSGSQAGNNIATVNQNATSGNTILSLGQSASDAMGRSQLFSAASRIGFQGAGMFANTQSSQGDFDKWFGAPKTNINPPPQG